LLAALREKFKPWIALSESGNPGLVSSTPLVSSECRAMRGNKETGKLAVCFQFGLVPPHPCPLLRERERLYSSADFERLLSQSSERLRIILSMNRNYQRTGGETPPELAGEDARATRGGSWAVGSSKRNWGLQNRAASYAFKTKYAAPLGLGVVWIIGCKDIAPMALRRGSVFSAGGPGDFELPYEN